MADAEAMLLSAVLRTGDFGTAQRAGVTSEMLDGYGDEWQWIERYSSRHSKTPSKASFRHRFPTVKLFAVDDVGHYADEVLTAHARRSVLESLEEAITQIDAGRDLQTVVRSLTSSTTNATNRSVLHDLDVFEDWASLVSMVRERVDRKSLLGLAGIPTGFQTLDSAIGGWMPGNYYVVGARLGTGKTWALCRAASTAAQHGYTVLYMSLEQSRAQIALRIQHLLSGVYGNGSGVFEAAKLMRGEVDLDKYEAFVASLNSKALGRIVVCDSTRGQVGVQTVAAQIEQYHPDIVLVDYLTLMARNGYDWQATGELSGQLKLLSERASVPIITAAQINRMGIGKEPPGAEHVAQADAIPQDADALITLKQITKRVSRYRLAKYRHGRDQQQWWVGTDLEHGRLEEITGNVADEWTEEDRQERDDE